MRAGPYELEEALGRGAQGAVYRGRAPDGRAVAVKVLLVAPDPETLARFEREARLLGSLGAENGFVPLLDVGREGGRPFLVFPLLTGGTLRDRLRGGSLPVAGALALGRALASALARAHARGVVHRDLKPENVLFDAEGRPLVADLGLARSLAASRTGGLTQSGFFAGTVGYAPPEQLEDAKAVGPAADVFALGVILHECLTGRRPFAGEALLAYAEALRRGPTLASDLPPRLAATIARALRYEASERFADAAGLARALEEERPSRRRALLLIPLLAPLLALPLALRSRPSIDLEALARVRRAQAPELARRAQEASDRHRLREALALATAAIALDPGHPEAWRVRALVKAWLHEDQAALADAERAVALDEGPDSLATLARVLTFLGENDRAKLESDRALARFPDHPRVLTVAAAVSRTDLDASLELVARALRALPDDRQALTVRASLRLERGDLDGALEDARRVLERAPSPLAQLVVAEVCLARGEIERGLATIGRAIELDPSYASSWYTCSRLRQAAGDLDGAIAAVRRCVALSSGRADPLVALGILLHHKGDREEALAALDRAVAVDGGSIPARRIRADVFETAGDDEAAATEFGRLIELLGDTGDAHACRFRRAHVLRRLGRLDEARADLDAIVSERRLGDPKGLELTREARALRAELAYRQDDAATARADSDAVIRDVPDHALALGVRAQLLVDGGRPRDALAVAEQLPRREKGVFPGALARARALRALGRTDEAQRALAEVKARSPACDREWIERLRGTR